MSPVELTDAEMLSAVREHWVGAIDRVSTSRSDSAPITGRAVSSERGELFVTYDRYGSRHTPESLEG